jgi:sensor histidine kinase regulating citrate/malate metabolism
MGFGYKISFQLIDKGNIEVIGPKSIGNKFSDISTKISNFHSGLLYFYLFIMICFLILFLTFSFSFYYKLLYLQNFTLFFLLFFTYILFFK